jgi:hypothetical protein
MGHFIETKTNETHSLRKFAACLFQPNHEGQGSNQYGNYR